MGFDTISPPPSQMPKVINKRHHPNAVGVYIGRPSKLGNPFVIGRDGTREEVLEKYMKYTVPKLNVKEIRDELMGQDLICWCAPLACHGDILLEIANATNPSP